MPGGGRPKGSRNKKTQELLTKAAAEGIMPIDVLLGDMRYFHKLGEEALQILKVTDMSPEERHANVQKALTLKSIARDCAQSVAPYLHPKLANIESNVNVHNVEAELAELE